MKTWDQLTGAEKERAVKLCVLEYIGNPFDLIFESQEAAIAFSECADEMERLETPWFMAEALMENEACKAEIEKAALQKAKGAIWLEGGEYALALPD